MAKTLYKTENLTRTHTIHVLEDMVHIETHYPTQTLTSRVPLSKVRDITISRDPTQRDPQYCQISIKGEGRQSLEIPEMESYKARQFKNAIDSQRVVLERKGQQKESNFTSRLKNMPILRARR